MNTEQKRYIMSIQVEVLANVPDPIDLVNSARLAVKGSAEGLDNKAKCKFTKFYINEIGGERE